MARILLYYHVSSQGLKIIGRGTLLHAVTAVQQLEKNSSRKQACPLHYRCHMLRTQPVPLRICFPRVAQLKFLHWTSNPSTHSLFHSRPSLAPTFTGRAFLCCMEQPGQTTSCDLPSLSFQWQNDLSGLQGSRILSVIGVMNGTIALSSCFLLSFLWEKEIRTSKDSTLKGIWNQLVAWLRTCKVAVYTMKRYKTKHKRKRKIKSLRNSPCQAISLQVLARCKFNMNSGTFRKLAMTEMKPSRTEIQEQVRMHFQNMSGFILFLK